MSCLTLAQSSSTLNTYMMHYYAHSPNYVFFSTVQLKKTIDCRVLRFWNISLVLSSLITHKYLIYLLSRLTLNISERQEEEEYSAESGGGSGGSGNPNRGQHVRQKYQHPKGAPDADLIFGPKKFKWSCLFSLSEEIEWKIFVLN